MNDPLTLVLETLRPGREHAQTLDVIAKRTRLARRDVEAAIQQLRMDGQPIATATSGIMGAFLARDAHELEPCVRALRGRASHQHETASALERTLERMRAPETLWDTAPLPERGREAGGSALNTHPGGSGVKPFGGRGLSPSGVGSPAITSHR